MRIVIQGNRGWLRTAGKLYWLSIFQRFVPRHVGCNITVWKPQSRQRQLQAVVIKANSSAENRRPLLLDHRISRGASIAIYAKAWNDYAEVFGKFDVVSSRATPFHLLVVGIFFLPKE